MTVVLGSDFRGAVGPSPVDRGCPDSKHHLIFDAHGLPLAVSLTGGHRNDIIQLVPLVDAVPTDPWPPWPTSPPSRDLATRHGVELVAQVGEVSLNL